MLDKADDYQEVPPEQEVDGGVSALVEWDNPPSLMDLKGDYEAARIERDNHWTKIKNWLDARNIEGEHKPKTADDRSEAQPALIRKQAEWRYPALSEPFLNTPDVFRIAPAGHNDTLSARHNQLVLNNQFNTQIDKVRFIDEYVRTAVDEGTVIVRVGWEFEEEEREVEEPQWAFYPANTPEAAAMLENLMMNPEQASPEWKEALARSAQMQRPFIPVQTGVETVTKMVTTKNAPTVEVCDFDNVVIDPSCQGDYTKAKFFVFEFTTSLGELREKGEMYQNLDKINVETESILASEDSRVDRDNSNFNFKDKPRKKFQAQEYWGFYDIHGDGSLVPIVMTWVGNTCIRAEEAPFPDRELPFVVVRYLPVRKSLYGEPDGALLEENQKIAGALVRGMIDLMAKSANAQRGMRKDMLDLTNRRKFDKGQDYEFNGNVDPRQGLIEHTFPEIPNSAYQMLQMTYGDAESLTGVKTYDEGINSGSLGQVAAGIRGALDAASKRELSILRRLADGVVQIGKKIISMNAAFLEDEEIIRITDDQFVAIKRDTLAGNYDLRLSISTAEEDNAKAQELAFMLQTMGNNVDFSFVQKILAEIARLRKMPDLAEMIEKFQPQPDPLVVEKAQLENQLVKAQIQKEQAIAAHYMSGRVPLDQAKTLEAQAKAENLQADTANKELDFVETESGVKQARELEIQGEQAKANAKLEFVKASLNPPKESSKGK